VTPRRRRRWDGFKREILNLPNTITIGRLVLVPPVLMLIHPTDPVPNYIAALLFALASGLDLLDGWLARRQGLVTVFGKFVDPLADKIMVSAVLVYLVHVDLVAPWVVAALLGREFYISGLRTVASAEGVVIAAGDGGKAKTAFQLLGICCVLVRYPYPMPGTDQFLDFHRVGLAFLYLSLVLAVVSAVQYTLGFRNALQERGSEGP
jgi:CDP-diacylglycerol--glycerol-3-phosphate 3-phosphatidyltransferase